MIDLSHMVPGDRITGLAVTSQQAAGNAQHENRAMTAPGTEPAGEVLTHPAPDIEAHAFIAPNTHVASEQRARPVIRMGEWNNL